MAIKKQIIYTADDGHNYTSFDLAQKAQREHFAKERARKARLQHTNNIQTVLSRISQNTSTNLMLSQLLADKPEVSQELRDALNLLLDYQRRIGKLKKAPVAA